MLTFDIEGWRSWNAENFNSGTALFRMILNAWLEGVD
jgi:hypothetical protein